MKEDFVLPGVVHGSAGQEVYEDSYDGFYRWADDTGRNPPAFEFRDYAAIEQMRAAMKPGSTAERALSVALRVFRSDMFLEIKGFLEVAAGRARTKKKPSVSDIGRTLSRSSSKPSEPHTQDQPTERKEPLSLTPTQTEGSGGEHGRAQGVASTREAKAEET